HVTEAELLPQARGHDDQLRVDLGLVEAERLDAELMELPVTSLLRLFPAEHRAAAPQLLLLVVQQTVAEARAHHAGRRLRTQRHAVPAAVLERIHLLLDDVRQLADRPAEELGAFEHRDADPPVAVGLEERLRDGLELLPQRFVLGEDVVHAAYGLHRAGHGNAYSAADSVNWARLPLRLFDG